jgi:Fur family ferric uptake transcriptional regulator
MVNGPRMTKQRQLILEELKAMDHHPTADEIYHRVREKMPRISLGTVYRNLEKLAASGVIRKFDYAGSQMRFDADLHGHHHIRCARCGRIDDIDGAPDLRESDREMAARTGYRLTGSRIEYLGICPACIEEGRRAEEEE